MRFGVLGTVTATTDDGAVVPIPGAKVRQLLAVLLVHRNRVVSADRLIDELWGEAAPVNPAGALQVRVSQLRKALQDAESGARDLVVSQPPGYLLRATEVDADEFAAFGAAGDMTSLVRALGLWRGPAFADMADAGFADTEITRLQEHRLVLRERLADLRLTAGDHDLLVGELAGWADEDPLRESVRGLQMRALYAAGRQKEALEVYADVRERLADELGLDPGPELTALQARILDQDAGLAPAPRAALVRNSVPAGVDELIGRGAALAALRAALDAHRLVTLIGPGGVGKTRLATETARDAPRPDGNWFVELAALPAGSPDVASRVALALGLHESAGDATPPDRRLVAALDGRDALLVLDNAEHVIEPVAELAATLLAALPGLRLLVTSRESLRIGGEFLYDVAPLALPDADDTDTVRRSAAARLFTARAAAHRRDIRIDDRTAAPIARLCRRLDGLPLALELAAARVRTLGIQGVLDRLDDRFALLDSGRRDQPARQRTLAAVIGWSWDLLDPSDRDALARLSVFSGGWTGAAAAVVCDADTDLLERLVDRSLVVVDEVVVDGVVVDEVVDGAAGADPQDGGAGPRYHLLESVREYAAARVTEPDALRDRHLQWCVAVATSADARLRGPEQAAALPILDAESGNLAAAEAAGGGLRLATVLLWYRFLRGRLTEALSALSVTGSPAASDAAAPWRLGLSILLGGPIEIDEVAGVLAAAATPMRARWFLAHALIERSELEPGAAALPVGTPDADGGGADGDGDDTLWVTAAVAVDRARLAHVIGDLDALARESSRGAELFAVIGDPWGQLQAADWQAGLAEMEGRLDDAAALLSTGLHQAEELQLWPDVVGKLSWLAWIRLQAGDVAAGRELAERARRVAADQGSSAGTVLADICLATALRRLGETGTAAGLLDSMIAAARAECSPPVHLPMILLELASIHSEQDLPGPAAALCAEAFTASMAMGSPRDAAGALESLAALAVDPTDGARLLGAAGASHSADPPLPTAETETVGALAGRLREVLGAGPFGLAEAEGAALDVADLQALVGRTADLAGAPGRPDGRTGDGAADQPAVFGR
ncbi:BTAD domain-containing putative transcriptional regulator [Nakamurella alba]|nr:BTAD domain-containing putative transcriptional regulator [Nakamurella alba]